MYRSSGRPAKVTKFEFLEGQVYALPDNSHVIHSEIFLDGDVEYLVVYAAVPDASLLNTERSELNVYGEPVPETHSDLPFPIIDDDGIVDYNEDDEYDFY